jgi:hypothetical protein
MFLNQLAATELKSTDRQSIATTDTRPGLAAGAATIRRGRHNCPLTSNVFSGECQHSEVRAAAAKISLKMVSVCE